MHGRGLLLNFSGPGVYRSARTSRNLVIGRGFSGGGGSGNSYSGPPSGSPSVPPDLQNPEAPPREKEKWSTTTTRPLGLPARFYGVVTFVFTLSLLFAQVFATPAIQNLATNSMGLLFGAISCAIACFTYREAKFSKMDSRFKEAEQFTSAKSEKLELLYDSKFEKLELLFNSKFEKIEMLIYQGLIVGLVWGLIGGSRRGR